MDYKASYTNSVLEQRVQAEEDVALARTIAKGESRTVRHGDNWQEVDLDEVVQRLAPGAKPEYQNGKIFYYNDDRSMGIVADVGGGYLRIFAKDDSTGRYSYRGVNGEEVDTYLDKEGCARKRSKSEFNGATHFKIKKRGRNE